MFCDVDPGRNQYMLTGPFARKGYDWWWHSFTARHETTGKEVPFFVEFFLINPARGGSNAILGQMEENRRAGLKPSYLMIKAGCWREKPLQLHRFYAWDEVTIRKGAPFLVATSDALCSDRHLNGRISVSTEQAARPEMMCDEGTIEFDLDIEKIVPFNVGYGASAPFRMLKAFEMYWHAAGMKSLYEGRITLNGERYVVSKETSFGYADKNWGRGFTSPWVWLSSCNLTSNRTGKKLNNSVFDIGGGRPKIYFLALNRKLLSAFYYEGEEFEYNFSKFWTGTRTRFASKETEKEILWHVRQENQDSVLDVQVRCKKSHMLLVNYEEPDGRKRHNRLWNGGDGTGRIRLYRKTKDGLLLIDDMKATHVGCEYGEFD